jgi:hypothetical protein
MQKARSQASPHPRTRRTLLPLVGMWFQGLFHSPHRGAFHLSLTVLGHTGVFSLGGWSPQLHARLLGSGVTQELHCLECVAVCYRALTVSGAPFQGTSHGVAPDVRGSYNPAATRTTVWARPVSLAATRGISRLISLPPGTEMFQFPGFASLRREMTECDLRRVAPFGHLGITVCVPLPRAYRSLPRPSSPPCAQASPTCLLSLDSVTRMLGPPKRYKTLRRHPRT